MKKFLKSWLKNNLILVSLILFLTSFTVLSFNITKPFYGEHDWNGVRYGNIARNYLKYSLIDTKLGQIENSGVASNDQFQFFTHYPPLLTLLIALSYKIFGMAEWTTRVVPILAAALSIVLIFLIGNKIANFKTGLIAALLASVTPLVLYFGKTPVHEPLVVMFTLLAFFSYLNYQTYKQRVYLIVFMLSLVLAELTTWAGFFLIPAMIIVAFARGERLEAKKLLPFLVLSMGVFLIYLGFVASLTGSAFGGDLLGVLLQRIGIGSSGQIENFNLLTYLLRLKMWFFTLYTTTLSILVGFWIIDKVRNKVTPGDWQIIVLGLFGLTYLVLFPNASYIHNYLIFYLLPFMALAGSAGWIKLTGYKATKKYALILTCMVVLVVGLERLNFLVALNSSNADRLAVEVGKVINSQTKSGDTVLINPAKFGNSADNFIKFYSDRKIIYSTDAFKPDVIVNVDQLNQSFYLEKIR